MAYAYKYSLSMALSIFTHFDTIENNVLGYPGSVLVNSLYCCSLGMIIFQWTVQA